MRINVSIALGFLSTAGVKAHDPYFSYNQIYNVNLDVPNESMANGDLEFSVSSHVVGNSFNVFLNRNTENDNDDGDENDEDDDPDDDDGSCSMLSNESLFRNPEPIVTTTTYVCKEETKSERIHSRRVSSSSQASAAFHLRGGATAGASTDILRKLLVVALVTLVYEGMIGAYMYL